MKQIIEKIFAFILVCIILISSCSNTVLALTEISSAYLENLGKVQYHLKYYKESQGIYSYIICTVVGHYYHGNFCPAYCLDKTLDGVGDVGSYTVDFTEMIKNEKLWRVIKNGYPYRKANEMGLSSDYDAYAVTKFAVYCVTGQSNLDYFYAEDDDYEARAMLAELKRLVNTGNNGTESQTKNLKIVKTADFAEDGDYYSVKYKVQSDVSINNYKVKSLTGFPDGSIVTDVYGNPQSVFGGGDQFKIRIPKSKLNSDISGKISVEAEGKIYPIFYGKTRQAGTQNYVTVADSNGLLTAETTFNVSLNKSKIIIQKKDTDTKKPIAGVSFSLMDSNKKTIKTGVTNSSGELEFSGLYQGKYYVKETKTTDNYELNGEERPVNLEYNKSFVVLMFNKHKTGNLKIIKTDKDNGSPIANVTFDLFSEEENKVIKTYKTDDKGEVNDINLRTGKYKLTEKNTNQWYKPIENKQIEIKANTTTEVKIQNELKKGNAKIEKVDSENTSIKIPNVKFEIYDQNMKKLEEITTNNQGIAYTSQYPLRDYQKLYIKEKEANSAYKLDTKTYEVTLKENSTSNITISNLRKKGKIKIVKVDKDDNQIFLDGVEFKIKNSKGDIVGVLVTNQLGEAESNNLPIDEEYTIVETNTKENYVLNNEPQKIKLEEDKISTLKFENEKKKGTIKILKVDKDNNEVFLKGVEFNILNSKGTIVDTVTTNEKGEAESIRLPIDDEYSAIETKTKDVYKLNNEAQIAKLEENQTTLLTFENEKRKGKIKIIKVDKDNNEVFLEGVEFNILNSNGEIVDTISTNEVGEAESKNLPIDDEYTVKEVKTKENYVLTEEPQKAIVKENETTELKFENEKKKGKIQIIKVDKDDNKVFLEGVKFNILNSNEEIVDTLTTDENGQAESKNLPIDDEYSVIETETLEKYLLTEDAQTALLEENEITSLTFENEKKKGQIKIIKTSKDDNVGTGETAGTPLKDVEFEVYDEKNKVIEVLKTDEEGTAISSKLPLGIYKVKETKTNEWYILDEQYHNAKISENDEIVVLNLENESVKPNVELEKTGQEKAEPNEEIKYEFDIKNTSNTTLENFEFVDKIPTDYIKVDKIETGTYKNAEKYDVYYKSNMTNDYVLAMEDLPSTENHQVDFKKELADNEYVTEIKLDFKTVEKGFEVTKSPELYAKVKENVKSEDTFINESYVGGEYKGYRVTDESKWKTMCYKFLPLTGM